MVIKVYSITLMLTTLVISSAYSQSNLSSKEEKKMLEKAEFYYEDDDAKNIPKALKLFEKLAENKPSDPYYRLMKGICYSYFKNRKEEALKVLLEVKSTNTDFNEVNFYLGRAYAVNNRFDEAIATYRYYIAAENITEDQRVLAKQNIIYCENAKKYMQDSVSVKIISIGSPINTEYSEYVPVITPDESMMIYTYRGEKSKGGLMGTTGKPNNDGQYYEDIMVSYKQDNNWLAPEGIADNINTVRHDASIAISVDGQELFIYKESKADGGDIYSSKLMGEDWSRPERLKGEINTDEWEGSATLTSDGKTLYFASEREGGFGGRDIYSAVLNDDNTWSEIENLGPVINTRFDDDAPFIHPDKKTMYFSSKGHNSMGGYDIFYTYLTDEEWDVPKNIGYPINTIDDDRYYVLSADAQTGYYSTAGRSENGTHDIYTVIPGKSGEKPVLALVVGVTKADGTPQEADIAVTNDRTGELEAEYKSNSTTGKYMLALTPGNKYKIAIEVEDYETKIDYIDIESLDTYVEVKHDFKIYSKGNPDRDSDDEGLLQEKIDLELEKYQAVNAGEGYEKKVYNKILNEKGSEEKEGVEYFLDLDDASTAVLDLDSTNYQQKTYASGTVVNMIGPFKNLLAAEVARQEIIKKDPILAKVKVKVNNNGNEETLEQYYAEDYAKTFEGNDNVSIHDKLTNADTTKVVVENRTVDLTGNSKTDNNDGLAKASDQAVTGLKFKVEIGAVSDTNEFKLQHFNKYGKITTRAYPDGITRYTFGTFATLGEAEEFRQMLAEKEEAQNDAFVTVFVFGERKIVDEISEQEQKELGIISADAEPCQSEMVDFSWFIGKDLNDKTVYSKLIATGANSCAEGLEFKVQIAAYKFPKNYKWDHLKQYGEPLVLAYPDKITRFTQGNFKTLGTAEVLRQKIIKSGQKDAWITPFYNGKRMLLEDLFKVNFYGKSIN